MASGDTLLVFTAEMNQPPATNPATLDWRNRHPVLDFVATVTSEYAIFTGVMPQSYAGTTGVTVYIHYSMATATSGDVDWDVFWERIGDGQQDVDADDWGTANSVDGTTVPGTSGLVDIVSVAFTDGADMESVAAGELFRLRVMRDIADTAAGDAELHSVEIRET